MSMMQMLLGTSSGGGGPNVSDVYSTDTYSGDGAQSRSITNGIDLSGEGGLVLLKSRSAAERSAVFDSERGVAKVLSTVDKTIQSNENYMSSFNSNGYTLSTSDNRINGSGKTYVTWSFRQAAKFFDCIKYTGNGSTQNISHSLDATPGFIITKPLALTKNWHCWHSAINTDQYFTLDTTDGINNNGDLWNDTAPTSSQFTVGNNSATNGSGQEYIAYLFAEDTSNVIKCGSYTGTGSGNHTITTGFEVQWVLIKKGGTGSADWILVDSARGANKVLYPSDSKAEDTSTTVMQEFTSNGFKLGADSDVNENNVEYIYVAIAAES